MKFISPTFCTVIYDLPIEMQILKRLKLSPLRFSWENYCVCNPESFKLTGNPLPQTFLKCNVLARYNHELKVLLPCPGIRDPESFTPASRLIIDSVRSPKTDPKKFRIPKAIALTTKKKCRLNILKIVIMISRKIYNSKQVSS